MSTHLHSLGPGDTLLFAAAIPSYNWTPNKNERVALIAGGAGITPMYQLAQGILNNPDDHTIIDLIYGVNSDSEILFKDQFTRWQTQFPQRFRATYVVRNPEPGSPHKGGTIDAGLLSTVLPNSKEHPGTSLKVFVCGPPPMQKTLTGGGGPMSRLCRSSGSLHNMGIPPSQIYTF
ncbi:hypothetical protein HIM_08265 [Hirsutella minnesotensis 3608]|uniref:Oxidoreductase FAD/NAD(P)-binding domain-containing protein n=1 Tax=Hirsutella minnesotensis 3608 TaxID=1043627 RepID=A0A0F8A3S5_9HYPO|nr:hypothetical protein HIM_08265 [Hirsutella minnesotensis 3608]